MKNYVVEHEVEQSFEGWVAGIVIYNEIEFQAVVEVLYTFEEKGLDYDCEMVYALSKVFRNVNTGILGENLIKFFKAFNDYIETKGKPFPPKVLEDLGLEKAVRSYSQFLIQYERVNKACI